jgi:hypothetical protein
MIKPGVEEGEEVIRHDRSGKTARLAKIRQ